MFRDDEGRLRLAWRIAIYLAGLLGLQIGAGIVVAIGLAVVLVVRGETLDAAALERRMIPLTIVAAPLITGGAVVLTFGCRRGLDRRTMASLGMVFPIPRPLATIGGGLALGSLPILTATGLLLAPGAYKIQGLGGEWMAWPLLLALVLMAFFEEIAFRGYLLQNFIDSGRVKTGVVFTSMLFWLAHSLNPAAWTTPFASVNLFAAGIVLSLAYLLSRNLWFPTALHFGWNATQGVLLNVPVSGIETPGWILVKRVPTWPDWLTGGDFGLEGSVVTSGVLAALIALLAVVQQRQQTRPGYAEEIFVADVVDESRE